MRGFDYMSYLKIQFSAENISVDQIDVTGGIVANKNLSTFWKVVTETTSPYNERFVALW